MFGRILKAIEIIKSGGMVILVDDENRENEGDLFFAAQFTTPEKINFMAKHARGLICLTLTSEWTEKLRLPMMVEDNKSKFKTGFTVSIEAREGVTTGISAYDRAKTILTAIDDNVKPEDIVKPGHIFPLKAKKGGVLSRTGQTEGSVDLAKLANLKPAGVICEIMNEDGTMSRMKELEEFSKNFDIPIVTIEDIISYRLQNERLVEKIKEFELTTIYGKFNAVLFKNKLDNQTHLALIKGNIISDKTILVRVHNECQFTDIFGIDVGVSSFPLKEYMEKIEKEGEGIILYLRNSEYSDYFDYLEGTSREKDKAILPREEAIRDFGIGAQILRDLGALNLKILTSYSKKFIGLEGYGLKIIEYVNLK